MYKVYTPGKVARCSRVTTDRRVKNENIKKK